MGLLTGLDPEMMHHLWRVSPAATAATLSLDDPVPWTMAPHLKLISDLIRNAVNGTGPRFNIISLAPRHGKSWLCSKWAPVWFLENHPEQFVMLCGYGANFAAEWGAHVRNVVSNKQDKLSFSLSDDTKAKNNWRTDKGGGMRTAGVGGDILGKGANLMVIDDAVKNAEEANSFNYRQSIWDWWSSTARTRLEPGGVVIVIMQRWHEDDLAGRLASPEFSEMSSLWHVVNLPAIYDEKARLVGPDPLGRKLGEPLWPGRWPLSELELLKGTMSPDDWESLYQGRPGRQSGKGTAYEGFSAANVRPVERDPELGLSWSLDFNRNPMSSVIAQYREELAPMAHLTNERLVHLDVLQEMSLPNSNTLEACQEFVKRTEKYVRAARGRRTRLEVFGDASGHQTHTASADLTDWIIVKRFFATQPQYAVTFHLTRSNPTVKARINAVNAALCSANGIRRLTIDTSCIELKKDFLEVKFKRDSGGNTMGVLDKSDFKRTHLTDALGYLVYGKFALRGDSGEMAGLVQ